MKFPQGLTGKLLDIRRNRFDRYANDIELVLLTFPLFFTWIYGILKYPVRSMTFLVSLHTGIITLVFLLLYGIWNMGNVFFEFPPDNPALIGQSILSATFLGISVTNFMLAKKGENLPGIKITQSLLDRLFQDEKASEGQK